MAINLFNNFTRDYDEVVRYVDERFVESDFFWLVDKGEKAILIFAYANNFMVCEEMKEDAERRYPNRSVRCEPVKK
jgi:hypothetical protein